MLSVIEDDLVLAARDNPRAVPVVNNLDRLLVQNEELIVIVNNVESLQLVCPVRIVRQVHVHAHAVLQFLSRQHLILVNGLIRIRASLTGLT